MGKKRIGLGLSCLHAHLADCNTDGDKVLAAEPLSGEWRRTYKLQKERGKSSVPRLLMSTIVGVEFPNEFISD